MEKGNEGKSFLQKCIRGTFGPQRVVKTEISYKKEDLSYLLSLQSLTCTDIFLFNLSRAEKDFDYGILENLKDGYVVSTKYRSAELKIKVPNVVVVFSNSYPITSRLSSDRWRIF